MVIDGRTISESDLKIAKLEGDRIILPARLVKQAGLAGTDPIDSLLIVLTAGRYRLLWPTTSAKGTLSSILDQWERVGARGEAVDWTEGHAQAAIRGRLIPCVISPPEPGWRINLPKEARYLATDPDASHIFILTVAGFVEIWFPATLRREVSRPISETLT